MSSSAEDANVADCIASPGERMRYNKRHNRYLTVDYMDCYRTSIDIEASEGTYLVEFLNKHKLKVEINRQDSLPAGRKFVFHYDNDRNTDFLNDWYKLWYSLIEKNPAFAIARNKSSNVLFYACTCSECESKEKPNNVPKPQFRPLLNKEQLEVRDYILNIFRNTNHNFSCMMLSGEAGTGKTTILNELNRISYVKCVYLSQTNMLVHTIQSKFDIEAITICKFLLMNLNISFSSWKILQEHINSVPFDKFDAIDKFLGTADVTLPFYCDLFELRKLNRWQKLIFRLALKHGDANFQNIIFKNNTKNIVLFLDEFTLFSSSLVGFFTRMLKNAINFINTQGYSTRCVLVICGDPNQIQSMTTLHYKDLTEIKSLASQFFELKNQHRIDDIEYSSFLKVFLQSSNKCQLLKSYFPTFDYNIKYQYNIDQILLRPESFSQDCLCSWYRWVSDINIENFVPLICYSYTNIEVHYNNLAMSLRVLYQLEHYQTLDKTFNLFKVFRFSKIYKRIFYNNSIVLVLDNKSKLCPVLPLIIGFPYKLLISIGGLPRSSILYLVHLTDKDIYMYNKNTDKFIMITQCNFEMNLFSGTYLYGYPLQMYYGETAQSSQGLTINKNIYCNLSNCTVNEAYVLLSRVKSVTQIKSIYIP